MSCCEKLHTAECNGHWELQVSSDKWPRLAVDQQTWGLSDLSLHQQTLLQPLGLSAGSCSHLLMLYSYCVSLFLFLLITCNSKPKSKMLYRYSSSKINNTAKICQLLINVPRGGRLNVHVFSFFPCDTQLQIHLCTFTFAAAQV